MQQQTDFPVFPGAPPPTAPPAPRPAWDPWAPPVFAPAPVYGPAPGYSPAPGYGPASGAAGPAPRRHRRRNCLIGGAVALVVVLIGFVVAGLVSDAGSDSSLGRLGDLPTVKPGTCLLTPDDEGSVASPADCTVAHDAEVYAALPLPVSPWPGYDELDDQADRQCRRDFTSYVGAAVDDSDYSYGWFASDEAEWRAGQREIVCVVLPFSDDSLVGGVAGTGSGSGG